MRSSFSRLWMIPFLLFSFSSLSLAQPEPIRQGIESYQQENYEEAIEILTQAMEKGHESTLAAFFLGMAHKKAAHYGEGARHLNAAVQETPRIKEALPELIDVLLILGAPEDLDAAGKWIAVAEEEAIFPARIAFLKGQLLKQTGDAEAAVDAFEAAAANDPELAGPSRFQIALSRVQMGDLEAAEKDFGQVIRDTPGSDLAEMSRYYRDQTADRRFRTRPLRLTLTLLGQYDTNMVLKPTETAAAQGITGEESYANTDILRVEYLPEIDGPFSFYGQYMGMLNLHEYNSDSHDLIGNRIALRPGYDLGREPGRLSLHLDLSYAHYLRRNPEYSAYMDHLTAGPLIRALISDNHLLEGSAGYLRKEFFEDPLSDEEDRDADGWSGAVSWVGLFGEDLFGNLRYEFIWEDTDGVNWEYQGHRITVGAMIPLLKSLNLQIGADAFFQDYENTHTVFGKARRDHTYTGFAGLEWELCRYSSLLLQYSRTRSNSNLGIYDYTRNLISAGVEIRF